MDRGKVHSKGKHKGGLEFLKNRCSDFATKNLNSTEVVKSCERHYSQRLCKRLNLRHTRLPIHVNVMC